MEITLELGGLGDGTAVGVIKRTQLNFSRQSIEHTHENPNYLTPSPSQCTETRTLLEQLYVIRHQARIACKLQECSRIPATAPPDLPTQHITDGAKCGICLPGTYLFGSIILSVARSDVFIPD